MRTFIGEDYLSVPTSASVRGSFPPVYALQEEAESPNLQQQ